MPDSKYFGIPFGTSGDKATIPEAVQPSGVVSFTQGFGPDYERDPATDPLAKRVPRDETNELYFQITNALKFLQLYGLPEWYDVDDAGNPVSYPVATRVRHADQTWVSLVATNTVEPGTDLTKWALDEAFSVSAVEASLAEAIAGLLGTKLITPRRLAGASQRGAWHWGVMGGTAAAATLTLSPPITVLAAGEIFRFVSTQNLNAGATINIDGTGPAIIGRLDGTAIAAGDIRTGDTVTLLHNGTRAVLVSLSRSQAAQASLLPQTNLAYTTPGATSFVIPAGVTSIFARLWGGGGGGGYYTLSDRFGAPSGGSAGAYAERRFNVSPGDTVSIVVGAGGLGGSANPAQPGQPGTASSVTINGVAVTAGGGPGGLNATASSTANAPLGSTFSNADFGIAGEQGHIGFSTSGATTAAGGYGGAAPLGGGSSPGGAGGTTGGAIPGGGGGATSDNNFAGGTGARGEVRLVYVSI